MRIRIESHVADLTHAVAGFRKLIQELFRRIHRRFVASTVSEIRLHCVGNILHDDHCHIRLLIKGGNFRRGLHGQGNIEHVFQFGALNGLADLHAVLRAVFPAAHHHLPIGGSRCAPRCGGTAPHRGPRLVGFRFFDFVAPVGEVSAVPQGHPGVADTQLGYRAVGHRIAAHGDFAAKANDLAGFPEGHPQLQREDRPALGGFIQPQQNTGAFAVGAPAAYLGFLRRQHTLARRRNHALRERDGVLSLRKALRAGNIHMQHEFHALLHGIHAVFIGFGLRAVLIGQPERQTAAPLGHIIRQIRARRVRFRQRQHREGREGIRVKADVLPAVFIGQAFKLQPFPAVFAAMRCQQIFSRRHGFVQTEGHFRAAFSRVKADIGQHQIRDRPAAFQRQPGSQLVPETKGFFFLSGVEARGQFFCLKCAAFRMNHAHCAVQRRVNAIHRAHRHVVQPDLQRQRFRLGQLAAAFCRGQPLPQGVQ